MILIILKMDFDLAGEQLFPVKFQPRFRLGRITNKYLIIEIYSMAYLSREEATYRMYVHDKSSRTLLI
jgi:hypothetical protein